MEIAYLKDTMYSNQKITHTRITVRAFAQNDSGKFVFLKIRGFDDFGLRDCLETSGGGVEENESLIQALHREIREELGFTCEIKKEIGIITDFYNLLQRKTVTHYYWIKLLRNLNVTERTQFESETIQNVVQLNYTEIDQALNPAKLTKINYLCQRRDHIAFQALKKIIAIKG